MIVYRVSGEGLLRLAVMAAAAPAADVDTILGILHGADIEETEPEPALPHVDAGPGLDDGPAADGADDAPGAKPAKPE